MSRNFLSTGPAPTFPLTSKAPELTAIFWLVKILATTLGETGGDLLSMSMNLGYLVSTGIFALMFAVCVAAQIRSTQFSPALYWLTIVATTTVGTTLADYVDRSLGIGYAGGSSLLLTLLLASLFVWHRTMGSISIQSLTNARAEWFYWITILFSQTLGTALGDWTADTQGMGYTGAALLFGGVLLLVAIAYFWTRLNRTALFWAAFVLTRPLGAVVGDFLDKPIAKGGLDLSRLGASSVLLVAIVLLLVIFPSRAAKTAH